MAWRGVAGPGEARQGKGTRKAYSLRQVQGWFIPQYLKMMDARRKLSE
jgi:hypothetical protein